MKKKEKAKVRQNVKIIGVLNHGKNLKEYAITDSSKFYSDVNFYIDNTNNIISSNFYLNEAVKDNTNASIINNYGMLFEKININDAKIILKQTVVLDSVLAGRFTFNLNHEKKDVYIPRNNHILLDGNDGYFLITEQYQSPVQSGFWLSPPSGPPITMQSSNFGSIPGSAPGVGGFSGAPTTGGTTGGGYLWAYQNILIIHINKEGRIVEQQVINRKLKECGVTLSYASYYPAITKNNDLCLIFNDNEDNVYLFEKRIDYEKYKSVDWPRGAISVAEKVGAGTNVYLKPIETKSGLQIMPSKCYELSKGNLIFYSAKPQADKSGQLINLHIE